MPSVIPEEPVHHAWEPRNTSGLWITNVRLPPPSRSQSWSEETGYDGTWTVKCSAGVVIDVSRTGDSDQEILADEDVQILDAGGGIMLPSCVSHTLAGLS